ncbi:MAG: DUF1559 domain-containing protein [Planctomycetota bacterium]
MESNTSPSHRLTLGTSSFLLLIACSWITLLPCIAAAQIKPADQLKQLVDDEVVGVFYIDLEQIDVSLATEKLTEIGAINGPERRLIKRSVKYLKKIAEAGAQSICCPVRLTDWSSGGPAFVVELEKSSDSEKVKSAIEEWMKTNSMTFPLKTRLQENRLFIGATDAQLNSLSNPGENQRQFDTSMWSSLGSGTVGLVLFGNPTSRRIVHEVMPELEEPLSAITGEMIAENIQWAGFQLDLSEKQFGFRLAIQTTDDDSANAIKQATTAGLVAMIQKLRGKSAESQTPSKTAIGELTTALTPAVNNKQVLLELNADDPKFSSLANPLKELLGNIGEGAVRRTRLQRLRTLALGMFNFESARSAFPPLYSVDDEGKPLLSWRVHILPFAGELELYNKFKLNEPWDSENNLPLVKEMPSFYWDPAPASFDNNQKGWTSFQAPQGTGFILKAGEPSKLSEIIDGTSNTLMFVTVAPKHAVAWTKPADWKVDLEDPTAYLKQKGRTAVEVVVGDGSTTAIPLTKSVKFWRLMLLAADGEVMVED